MIREFRAAHALSDFAVDVRPLVDTIAPYREGPRALDHATAAALRVSSIVGVDAEDAGLRAAAVHVKKPTKMRITQCVVPVYATILVKKLVEDTDGVVNLVGTVLQRPLLFDLQQFDRESGNAASQYFNMRVNEGEHSDCFTLRKVARSLEKAGDPADPTHPSYLTAVSSTFEASIPMKLDSVYNQQPFNIMSATIMVELTSFIGKEADGDKFEFRPTFMAHASDIRNLVSVRDFATQYKMDEMRKWELMNPNPTVEFEYDGGGQKPLYVPKVRLTYYLFEEAMQPFLETVMPIVFAYFASTLNVFRVTRKSADFTDYLANAIAIGLTIVFIVPEISKSDSFDEKFQLNHVYVFWIFLGQIAAAPAYYYSSRLQMLSVAFMWASLSIPLFNMFKYHWTKRQLNKAWDVPRMTFLGRPGKESKKDNKRSSSNMLDANLQHFVVKTDNPERPVELNPDVVDPAARHALSKWRGRPVPWQIDTKNKLVYSGTPRHYFNDASIKAAIDGGRHQAIHD